MLVSILGPLSHMQSDTDVVSSMSDLPSAVRQPHSLIIHSETKYANTNNNTNNNNNNNNNANMANSNISSTTINDSNNSSPSSNPINNNNNNNNINLNMLEWRHSKEWWLSTVLTPSVLGDCVNYISECDAETLLCGSGVNCYYNSNNNKSSSSGRNNGSSSNNNTNTGLLFIDNGNHPFWRTCISSTSVSNNEMINRTFQNSLNNNNNNIETESDTNSNSSDSDTDEENNNTRNNNYETLSNNTAGKSLKSVIYYRLVDILSCSNNNNNNNDNNNVATLINSFLEGDILCHNNNNNNNDKSSASNNSTNNTTSTTNNNNKCMVTKCCYPAFCSSIWPKDVQKDYWYLHTDKYVFHKLGDKCLESLLYQIIICCHLTMFTTNSNDSLSNSSSSSSHNINASSSSNINNNNTNNSSSSSNINTFAPVTVTEPVLSQDTLFVIRGIQIIMQHALYESYIVDNDDVDNDDDNNNKNNKSTSESTTAAKRRSSQFCDKSKVYKLNTERTSFSHQCLYILRSHNINIMRALRLAFACANFSDCPSSSNSQNNNNSNNLSNNNNKNNKMYIPT